MSEVKLVQMQKPPTPMEPLGIVSERNSICWPEDLTVGNTVDYTGTLTYLEAPVEKVLPLDDKETLFMVTLRGDTTLYMVEVTGTSQSTA